MLELKGPLYPQQRTQRQDVLFATTFTFDGSFF